MQAVIDGMKDCQFPNPTFVGTGDGLVSAWWAVEPALTEEGSFNAHEAFRRIFGWYVGDHSVAISPRLVDGCTDSITHAGEPVSLSDMAAATRRGVARVKELKGGAAPGDPLDSPPAHVTSLPIDLEADTAVARPTIDIEGSVEVEFEPDSRVPEFPGSLADYRWDKRRGLMCRAKDEWIEIGGQVYWPELLFTGEDGQAMIKMRCLSTTGQETWFDVPNKDLGTQATTMLMMCANGLNHRPDTDKMWRTYLMTWAAEIRKQVDSEDSRRHMGWQKDGSFLLGSTEINEKGETKEVMVGAQIGRYVDDHKPQGSLDKYVERGQPVVWRAWHGAEPVHLPVGLCVRAGVAGERGTHWPGAGRDLPGVRLWQDQRLPRRHHDMGRPGG